MPLSNTGTDRFLAANYYSKTQLNAGQLDSRYFAESEFIATSAGAGDAGKPIKLNGSGVVDATIIPLSALAHNSLSGLTTGDPHTQYAPLAGRAGGMTLYGGTSANDDIIIHGTSDATRTASYVILQPSGGQVQIGTAANSPSLFVGGITDAGNDGVRLHYSNVYKASYIDIKGTGGLEIRGDNIFGTTGLLTLTNTGALNVTGNITQNGVPVVTTTGTQTLTNKTLTAPIISSISNTGTLTLPTSTDTLVGRATTDTLTNKTLTSATLTTPTISGTGFTNAQHAHTGASSGGTLDHGAALTGLGDDDHTQYALLAGRSGGSTLYGGTAANDDLTLHGTSNATRTTSYIILQPSGGQTIVGASSPLVTHPFEVQANNYAITLNPGFGSATNYISSYTSGSPAPLALYGSRVFIDGDTLGIGTAKTPTSSADATGSTGDICWNSTHLFVKTGAGAWKRVALSTF